MELNEISGQIIDAAMKVHTALGPGLLESAYEKCLAYELRTRGMRIDVQLDLPLRYGNVVIEAGYRIDLLVENTARVEWKAVEAIPPIHEAQLLSYLRLSGKKLGLLINFNVVHLKNGIKRMVHNH